MARTKKPLWTCPKCGHRFVTRNMWHSCSDYSLESHFEGTKACEERIPTTDCPILASLGKPGS
jgi:hypothetical protein